MLARYRRRLDNVLVLEVMGNLFETASSNIFIVKDYGPSSKSTSSGRYCDSASFVFSRRAGSRSTLTLMQ